MKYPAETYAEAFLAAVEKSGAEHAGATLKRFVYVIEKNGDMLHAGKIADAVERRIAKDTGDSLVLVESARPLEASALKKLEKELGHKKRIRVKTNPELVAGVRITVDGESELDMSLRRKIHLLFS